MSGFAGTYLSASFRDSEKRFDEMKNSSLLILEPK